MFARQISKPVDEQAFERSNLILWRCMLNDETAILYGSRGQHQYGVDILGIRNANPNHLVGIQCKLKSEGKLTTQEVRLEVKKTLAFEPPLSEYVIVTTAPDDAKLQSLAKQLSIEESNSRGQDFKISIYGWGSLQVEIRRYPEAIKAFDPSYTPEIESIRQKIAQIPEKTSTKISPKLEIVRESIEGLRNDVIGQGQTDVQHEYQRSIDEYIELIRTEPGTALGLFKRLQKNLQPNTSKFIRFRIETNIASCLMELGQEIEAADKLIHAWHLAPKDPKAIANRALGFLIKKNWINAKEFAETELQKDPENADLAGWYVRSLIHDKDIKDPISHVPEEVSDTPQVMEAHIAWAMERESNNSWWELAIFALRRFPELGELQIQGASALLSRAIGGERYVFGQELNENERTDIHEAIQIYESLWPGIRDKTVKQHGDLLSVPQNLMIAYRIIGDNSSAIKVGKEATARFPDECKIREFLSAFLIDEGEVDQASNLISQFEESKENAVIRYKLAVSRKDWSAIISVVDEYLSEFHDSEKNVACAMRIAARIEQNPEENILETLESEYEKYEGDTRALIILAKTARNHNQDNLAQTIFEKAVIAFQDGDDSYAARLAISEEAILLGHLDIVIQALYGHVGKGRDSEELRLLARALATDLPIRDRANEFFRELPKEIRQIAFFQYLEGILNLNRGAPNEAIAPLTSAFEEEPHINTLLQLISAYYRIEDQNSIRELVRDPKIESLPGTPFDRINLSHALLDYSESGRALRFAYDALTFGLNNPEIAMKFIGLVLRVSSADEQSGQNEIIKTGVWVRLSQADKPIYEVLVGETCDRPWGQAVEERNPFISKCLGMKAGDTFKINNQLGKEEIWRVDDVKPWWLKAFRHLSADFGQRFPEENRLISVTVHDEDIEPVLEQVRRQSAFVQEQADIYLQHDIPLVIAAGNRPGGVLGFAQYLCSIDEHVKVCVGTPMERDSALQVIENNHRPGAVIDAYTAWHAAAIGVLEVLEERLGTIAIPASEMDRLKEITEDSFGQNQGESMSLEHRDGQYYRYLESQDERVTRLNAMKNLVKDIERHCTVEPIKIPNQLSDLGEKLIGMQPLGAFNAAAMTGTRLLICDDIVMRQWAHEAFGVQGIWLQAALLSAEQAGTISINSYADSVVYLAAHHHSYISVSTPILLSVFERDEGRDFFRLEALYRFVGGENADIESNVKIATEFINIIWANSKPIILVNNHPADYKTMNATNLLFRKLFIPKRDGEWLSWATSLYRQLTVHPKRYFLSWCEENYFPIGKIISSLR